MTVISDNVGIIAIGIALLLLALFLLFRPKQKVRLTDSAPQRPHMVASETANEGFGVLVTDGARVGAGPKDATHPGRPDDLLQLKGVGPKLADALHQHGLTRFDQIASLSEAQVAAIDETLGAFRGRLTRDRVVEQADYLARGDRDGFEAQFGKL